MQEESMRQNGNEEDGYIRMLKRNNIPVTRENYLGLVYPDGVPEDFGAELEMELPEQFREK